MRYEERCLPMRKQKMNFWHVFALSFEITGLRHIFLKLPLKVSAFLPPITLFQENITDVSSFTRSKYFDNHKQTSCHTLKKELNLFHDLTWSIFKFGSQSDSVNIQVWFAIWLGQYSSLVRDLTRSIFNFDKSHWKSWQCSIQHFWLPSLPNASR